MALATSHIEFEAAMPFYVGSDQINMQETVKNLKARIGTDLHFKGMSPQSHMYNLYCKDLPLDEGKTLTERHRSYLCKKGKTTSGRLFQVDRTYRGSHLNKLMCCRHESTKCFR